MKNFEEHIRHHKKQLEPDHVNPKIWMAIENELLRARDKRKSLYLKVASLAAAILLGVFLFPGQWFNKKADFEQSVLTQYGLEQYDFPQQIHQKKTTLAQRKIPLTKREDFKILLQQLAFLDEQYYDYLAYIEKNGYQEFIGNQILNHYQSKIELLNKIQEEIEKINYYENKFPSNEEKVELGI